MRLLWRCAWLLAAVAAAPPRWTPVTGPWDGADGPIVGVETADGPWVAWQRGGALRARPARGGDEVVLLPMPRGTVRDVSFVGREVRLTWVDDAGTPRVDTVPVPFAATAASPAVPAERPPPDVAPDPPGAQPTPGDGGVAWVIPEASGAVLAWSEGGVPAPVLRGSGALRAGRAFVVGRDLWLPWADADGWHVVRQAAPTR